MFITVELKLSQLFIRLLELLLLLRVLFIILQNKHAILLRNRKTFIKLWFSSLNKFE